MHSVLSTPFGRVYGIDGSYFPSVTTVLSGFNPNCQEFSNDYAVLGTRCHYEILGLYKTLDEPDSYYSKFSEKEVSEKLDRANDMWQTVDIGDVLDVEMLVYDRAIGYAGSLDMLTEIQQKTTLVDLKTGNYYAKYPLQIAAYARACPQPVEQALIVRLDLNLDRNPDSLVDMIWYTREQLDEYEAKFCAKAEKFHADQQSYIDSMSW